MAKNPTQMTMDEIVHEIGTLSEQIEVAASRVGELSRLLLSRSRVMSRTASQTPSVDSSPEATKARKEGTLNSAYANAWARLGNMVVSAVKRTRVADRTLARSRADLEIQIQDQQRAALRKAQRESKMISREASWRDSLVEKLYGEED